MGISNNTKQAIHALGKLADLWQSRLATGWTPPDSGAFPWTQVRLSLSALLPGMGDTGAWVARAAPDGGGTAPQTVTVVLAGNTPLLAWSPLCACLLSGAETVRVKLSRDESVWTRRFVEDLEAIAPEVAARIELYDFRGEDERTYALLVSTDAVIAYGSDASIAAIKARTPPDIPFFGYGHAVSIGFAFVSFASSEEEYVERLAGFARDVLMYGQNGCLSPHIIYSDNGHTAISIGKDLPEEFASIADALDVPHVLSDMVARAIREAQDLALFDGYTVSSDPELRWTVAFTSAPKTMPSPVGYGFIRVAQVYAPKMLRELLQPVWGIVTCAGVAGKLPPGWEAVLREAGVSRICKPGEMQTPPLDWRNGNRDLLAELLRVRIER